MSLLDEPLWLNYRNLPDLYEIWRDINSGVWRNGGRGIGISIVSGSGSDVGSEVENGDDGEVGL